MTARSHDTSRVPLAVVPLKTDLGREQREYLETVKVSADSLLTVNLVGNAIKFTDEGEIAVKVRQGARDEDELVLHFTVSDTGIGIPEDKPEMIFDPFSRADSSTTRKYGGTGLGRAISARLVRMMGGRFG